MPLFLDGESAMNKFIRENLKYPQSTHKRGIPGCVAIRFVVQKTSKIQHYFHRGRRDCLFVSVFY